MIGKKYFLNACGGSFSEIPEEGTAHHSFEEIVGRLLHIKFKNTKSGESMRLYVVDQNNLYIIAMFVKSRPANVFFLTSRNLDLRSEMKFKMRREDNKDFLSIYQFGNSVRWYFDQNNQHELPQDQEEKRAYLRKIVEEEIMPSLEKIVNPFPSHPIYKPMGSGNGLKGGYFGHDVTRVRMNPISDDELKTAGYTDRLNYITRNSQYHQ